MFFSMVKTKNEKECDLSTTTNAIKVVKGQRGIPSPPLQPVGRWPVHPSRPIPPSLATCKGPKGGRKVAYIVQEFRQGGVLAVPSPSLPPIPGVLILFRHVIGKSEPGNLT